MFSRSWIRYTLNTITMTDNESIDRFELTGYKLSVLFYFIYFLMLCEP